MHVQLNQAAPITVSNPVFNPVSNPGSFDRCSR